MKDMEEKSQDYSLQIASTGHFSQHASVGDFSRHASAGEYSQHASEGHCSIIVSSGDYSRIDINGDDSVGACVGFHGRIKGKKGCWITLAEWGFYGSKERFVPVCVKSAQIDGIKLKENTWYTLENGEFVPCE